jgi:hypothetical protein
MGLGQAPTGRPSDPDTPETTCCTGRACGCVTVASGRAMSPQEWPSWSTGTWPSRASGRPWMEPCGLFNLRRQPTQLEDMARVGVTPVPSVRHQRRGLSTTGPGPPEQNLVACEISWAHYAAALGLDTFTGGSRARPPRTTPTGPSAVRSSGRPRRPRTARRRAATPSVAAALTRPVWLTGRCRCPIAGEAPGLCSSTDGGLRLLIRQIRPLRMRVSTTAGPSLPVSAGCPATRRASPAAVRRGR